MPDPDYLSPEDGFLGREASQDSAPEEARAAVLPYGLEATVTFAGGTAKGPQAILNASQEVELFDEEYWREPVRDYGVATLAPPEIPQHVGTALDGLAAKLETILAQRRFPLVLGGEHSITPGAIRPFLARVPDLAVLHFDAHADLRDGYRGEAYSHASAIRRVMDDPAVEVVSVGLRNIAAEEAAFFEANGERLRIHWAKDKPFWRLEEIVAPLRNRPIYLTVDLDAFDSAVMPATGTPEPGGLLWQEVLAILREAAAAGSIVGADIAELAPQPGLHGCDFLAAKLGYKILSYALAGPPPAPPRGTGGGLFA